MTPTSLLNSWNLEVILFGNTTSTKSVFPFIFFKFAHYFVHQLRLTLTDKVYLLVLLSHKCDMVKGNESHVKDFKVWVFDPTFWCHILIPTLLALDVCLHSYEHLPVLGKNQKIDFFLCQYIKNNIWAIILIPLDHVTTFKGTWT